jgi:hypothetical protein
MRRLLLLIFLTLFGLGVGLAIGAITMRRVDKAASKVAPENIADQAVRTVTVVRHRLRDAIEEGSRARAETEADLRERFNVPEPSEIARMRTEGRSADRTRAQDNGG